MADRARPLRIAFIVGAFPVTTETFIINQVADLIDTGATVDVFSLGPGMTDGISDRYYDYRLDRVTHYLHQPRGYVNMLVAAIPRIARILCLKPALLWKLLHIDFEATGLYASKLVFLAAPFAGRTFDVVHCHFGPVANQYVQLRRILGHDEPLVTSFYGYDVSQLLQRMPAAYYDDLKKESSLFFVMSANMQQRVVAAGFDANKVVVLPVSIDVHSYPYRERTLLRGDAINIVSVGRFVEKKGFDDIVRAISLVKSQTSMPFKTVFVGGGPQENMLRAMVKGTGIEDVVEFKGYMREAEIVELFMGAHLFVQPSKTASDGDME